MAGTLREEFLSQLDHILEEAAKHDRTYEPAAEPPAPRPRKAPKLGREESFARLDVLIQEARAGAPDEWLARHAHVAPDAVLYWRKARQIRRPTGRARAQQKSMWALDLLGGSSFQAPMHPARSDFDGLWESPEYVLRRPMNYRELCRMVYTLNITLGAGPELICEALGLRERDVELAMTVWTNHLARSGVPCKGCGNGTDPRYGEFCSVRCAVEGT